MFGTTAIQFRGAGVLSILSTASQMAMKQPCKSNHPGAFVLALEETANAFGELLGAVPADRWWIHVDPKFHVQLCVLEGALFLG